jgi:protein phosphatase
MSQQHSPANPALLRWFGWTDRGKVRKNNEDSFLGLRFDAREVQRLGRIGEGSNANADYAFAVSDGMGGAQAGEYASNIAIEKITTLLPRSFDLSAKGFESGFSDVLTELFDQTHKALVYLGGSYEECRGMEATLTLSWFAPGWMYFAHIGDSRVYSISKVSGRIKQLSEDDTYVGWLFRKGEINEREARNHPRRNVLQKALGGSNQFVDPQVGAVAYEPGDMFLLCTDGLVKGLHDDGLLDILRPSETTGQESNPARLLVEESIKNDGSDNTTAVVIQVT